MKHKDVDVVETFEAHADQLNSAASHNAGDMSLSVKQGQEMASLLHLAQQIKEALAPMRPSAAFKQKLELQLTEAARQRVSGDVRMELPPRRELVIGAAIGSVVALVGGVVYWMRTQSQVRSQHVG